MIMELWIARDSCGEQLYLYRVRPKRCETMFASAGSYGTIRLRKELFPEVTFENSPKRVELKLIEDEPEIIIEDGYTD